MAKKEPVAVKTKGAKAGSSPSRAAPPAAREPSLPGEIAEAKTDAKQAVKVPEAPAASMADTVADLALLERFRWFRMALAERICAESKTANETTLALLRQEPTVQFAEFLYLLSCQNLTEVSQVERLAELHNTYIVELSKDDAKMGRLGLHKDRLLDAIFTSDTLPRLVETWRDKPGAIDQSNLARLLAALMSAETCRKVAVASAEAGFLERWRTPYGTYLVRSTGTLERIFAATLREARLR